MTPGEAKQLLLLYRPGAEDRTDPALAEALELAQRDPELGRWLEDHRAFQQAMRAKLRQIKVPADLRNRILGQAEEHRKVIRPTSWWQQPEWLAAAAAIVLLCALAMWWMKPAVPDRFANYEARMVSSALREYQMSIQTNDMGAVRQNLSGQGAPADYVIPAGLQRLSLTGGGVLRWRENPVAMVCFDRGDKQMLFLFVMNRSAVKDPPPSTPQTGMVRGLFTARWTKGDKTYLLAGPEEPDFLQKYL